MAAPARQHWAAPGSMRAQSIHAVRVRGTGAQYGRNTCLYGVQVAHGVNAVVHVHHLVGVKGAHHVVDAVHGCTGEGFGGLGSLKGVEGG